MNVVVYIDGVMVGKGTGVKSDERNPTVLVTEPNGEQFEITCMPEQTNTETLSDLTSDQKCDLNELVNQEISMLEDIAENGEYSSETERKFDEDRLSDMWEILRAL